MMFDYRYYQSLLETLLENHQPVIYPDRNDDSAPCFLMRHDIDRGLEFVGAIPDIERSLSVRATYFVQVSSDFYNPFSTVQASILERLLSMSHRLGLHFDCVKNGAELLPGELPCAIGQEMELLERYFGPVDAVSFHQPSREIIENRVRIPHVNTYDHQDMLGFEYFSDSAQRWSKGDPILHIRRNRTQSFQILTHPFLWGNSQIAFADRSLQAVLAKAQGLYDYDARYAKNVPKGLRVTFVGKDQET